VKRRVLGRRERERVARRSGWQEGAKGLKQPKRTIALCITNGASVAHTRHKTDTERLDTSNLTKRNDEYDLIPRKNEPRDVADLNSAVPVPIAFAPTSPGVVLRTTNLFFFSLGLFQTRVMSKLCKF